MTTIVSVLVMFMLGIMAVRVAYEEGKSDGFIEGADWKEHKLSSCMKNRK